jgi:hypothetical protein
MEFIQSSELPPPAGHYSQAAAAGGLVFLSGILPARADVDPAVAGFAAQCASVFDQCEKVLRAAGCGFGDVSSARPTSPASSTGRPLTPSMRGYSATTVRRAPWCRCRPCTMASWSKCSWWRNGPDAVWLA